MASCDSKIRYHLCCPRLPLAVYREVAAHLRQVEGVQTGLVPMSKDTDGGELPKFDPIESQIAALSIEYSESSDGDINSQVERILAYYGDRYGSWQSLDTININ
ncbi:MAG: hypothetical protein P5680_02160 [Limnospira sp. PMC 737.11]|uniref:hypothetical protein n=1 Tax=Limnospira sp. PMC 737.11 TaxID=2981095 RepID=UPI0028E11EC2|nr:hypothetical protein [Limnospira sp. PMC 737.11]MDT9273382.1 hypothetical protein [Limnospira sp. PMC 737.11]